MHRHPEDDPRGDQPQKQQREDQLGAESRAEDAAPPLHQRLDEVAHQEDEQGENQQRIGEEQRRQQDRVGDVGPGEIRGAAEEQVSGCKRQDQDQDAE